MHAYLGHRWLIGYSAVRAHMRDGAVSVNMRPAVHVDAEVRCGGLLAGAPAAVPAMLRWAVHRSLPACRKAAFHPCTLCVALKLKPPGSEAIVAFRSILRQGLVGMELAAPGLGLLSLGRAAAWELWVEDVLIRQQLPSPTAVLTMLRLLRPWVLGS